MHLMLLQFPNKIIPNSGKFIVDLSPAAAVASSVLEPASAGMTVHIC